MRYRLDLVDTGYGAADQASDRRPGTGEPISSFASCSSQDKAGSRRRRLLRIDRPSGPDRMEGGTNDKGMVHDFGAGSGRRRAGYGTITASGPTLAAGQVGIEVCVLCGGIPSANTRIVARSLPSLRDQIARPSSGAANLLGAAKIKIEDLIRSCFASPPGAKGIVFAQNVPGPGQAKVTRDTATTADWTRVAATPKSARVRVVMETGDRMDGRGERVGADSITSVTGGQSRELAAQSRSIARPERRNILVSNANTTLLLRYVREVLMLVISRQSTSGIPCSGSPPTFTLKIVASAGLPSVDASRLAWKWAEQPACHRIEECSRLRLQHSLQTISGL